VFRRVIPGGRTVRTVERPRPREVERLLRCGDLDSSRTLETIFGRLRETAARESDVAIAARRFERAQRLLGEGDDAEAVADLHAAVHEPLLRFKAASALGCLYLRQGAPHAGNARLECAAAVPPTGREDASAVLYELGDALERAGQSERALVTFMKTDVHMGTYRVGRARIARVLRAAPPVDPS
jgi:hypothetical protein